MTKLRVGKIPYANLFPIFHTLQTECDCRNYEFIDGHPSELNAALREGLIDISISSSVLYLKEKDAYSFLEGHSVSSKGPVESILLLTRQPIEALDRAEVFVTHQSETSPVLLDVILREFYGINASLKITRLPLKEAVHSHSAYLAIGDSALIAKGKARRIEMEIPLRGYTLGMLDNQVFYIYDLGMLWQMHTALPFVYALWIYKKDTAKEKAALLEGFKADLDKATGLALGNLPEIAEASGMKDIMGVKNLLVYWRGISYGLDEEHLKGLELFGKYAGLLPKPAENIPEGT